MADLFGLSPADRDTLMRMIARERANYTADVRSLAPVPRPRVMYKPSSALTWFVLMEPLYPASDYSPTTNQPWSATARQVEWDDDAKRWFQVYPEVEETIYSTGTTYGMTCMVIPCQKTNGVWEAVASAPPDDRFFCCDSGFYNDGDFAGTTNAFYVEDTATTPDDKSGFLDFPKSFKRLGNHYGYFVHSVDRDRSVGTPSTDGTLLVRYTGVYEIAFSCTAFAAFLTPTPGSPQRKQNTTAYTGTTSGHYHDYYFTNPWDGGNKPVRFKPHLWRKPSGGSYARESGQGEVFGEVSMVMVDGSSQYAAYHSRIVMQLDEGDRLGLEVTSSQLLQARLTLHDSAISFRLLSPGTNNNLGAA